MLVQQQANRCLPAILSNLSATHRFINLLQQKVDENLLYMLPKSLLFPCACELVSLSKISPTCPIFRLQMSKLVKMLIVETVATVFHSTTAPTIRTTCPCHLLHDQPRKLNLFLVPTKDPTWPAFLNFQIIRQPQLLLGLRHKSR